MTESNVIRIRDQIAAIWTSDLGSQHSNRDERVESTMSRIRDLVREGRLDKSLTAPELGRAVGLSTSRLAALFREGTGVPIRPFILWTRLQLAVETISTGSSLTEASHAAGFADSAHLARTFRRMFGTTLSGSIRQLRVLLLNI